MNIYEVIRKLVEARGFTATEQSDALKLLTELEQVNALGTLASRLDEKDHECERGGDWFPESMQCRICGKGLDPPSHGCIPVQTSANITGWHGAQRQYETRCKICNKEFK